MPAPRQPLPPLQIKPVADKAKIHKVSTEPSQIGYWTNNNQFGQKQVFNPSLQSQVQVAKLGENGPPEVWTVQLGIQSYPDPGMTGNIYAQIEFGAGGTTDTVEVDWQNGTSISLPMNAASIFVKWDVAPGISPPNVMLNVDCSFARGNKAGQPPTRKLARLLSATLGAAFGPAGFIVMPPLSNVRLAIPRYATTFFMNPISTADRANFQLNATSTVFLEFQNPNGPTGYAYPLDYYPNGIRLPPLTTKVSITNTSAIDDLSVLPFTVLGL